MLRTIRRHTIALLAGAFLVVAIPWLDAGIAALPGLRLLIDGIRSAGLPVRYIFPLLTRHLPDFLLAFTVGFAVFELLGGRRGGLLAAAVFPWVAMLAHGYVDACLDTEIACFGAFPFLEWAGILDVPLGLALAALAAGPSRPDMPVISVLAE